MVVTRSCLIHAATSWFNLMGTAPRDSGMHAPGGLCSDAGWLLPSLSIPAGQPVLFQRMAGVGCMGLRSGRGFCASDLAARNSDRILWDFSPDDDGGRHDNRRGSFMESPHSEHAAFVVLTNTQRAAFLTNSQSLLSYEARGFTRLTHARRGRWRCNAHGAGSPARDRRPRILARFITQGHRRWFATAAPTRIAAVDLDATSTLKQYSGGGRAAPPRSAPTDASSPPALGKAAARTFGIRSSGDGSPRWGTKAVWRGSVRTGGNWRWARPTEFLFYDAATWQCSARFGTGLDSALSGILAIQ